MTMELAARRLRRVAAIDLAAYERPVIAGNRSLAWRIAWHVCGALLFQSALVLPSIWKAALLRLFGARVGRGLVVKPRVTIKYPWFLALGDHVWLGEQVWIDNHCLVTIGSSVCISQGAYLFTGNHDYDDPRFRFFCKPVTIEDGAWVAARAIVCPGSLLRRMSVVGAGVVWSGVAEEGSVCLAPAPTGRLLETQLTNRAVPSLRRPIGHSCSA
jgi:putative colanic acid biosynthesis acetyltransferase WcaF